MVTLAMLMKLAPPGLYYSHKLSTSPIDSKHRATPDGVTSWDSFEKEVAKSCATVDNTMPCHRPAPFPADGFVEISVSACPSHSLESFPVPVAASHTLSAGSSIMWLPCLLLPWHSATLCLIANSKVNSLVNSAHNLWEGMAPS